MPLLWGGLIVYPDVLYSGRFQSKDDGQTWQEVSNEYPVTGGTPGYPSALYHFNSTGVLQDSIILLISRDGAVTWNQVLTPQVREQINIVDFDSFVPPNIVLGWPEAGLFKANALDPKDWTKLHWPPGTSGRKEVAFHPTNPDVVWVAAAGHLLGLEREAWVSALGLASNQASGTLNWTSDPTENSRPFNPGLAARNGVTAALLAQAGFGGPRDVFEGKYDFFTAFSDTRHPEALVEGWGRRYAITELAVKRYPTVAQSHSGLDGLLEIRDEQGLTIEEISKIDLRIAPLATRVIDNNTMRSHCAQYVLAVAALRGKVEPEDVLLSDHRSDPRVQRLFESIRVIPDDDLAGTYPEHYETIIEVTTTDGEIHRKRVLSARGLPDNPMTREEVLDKFLALATTVVSRERADEIVRMVDGVEALSDIRDLARLLVVKS
ncbi:MAG: MmgE/PrpD family protein [Chloroflexi bacterium]|nr:MmgE/PrpD family protein [Chloroflexota bacterium]